MCRGTLSGAFGWSECWAIGFDWLENWLLFPKLPSVDVDGVGDDVYRWGKPVQVLGTCKCCGFECDACAIWEWSKLVLDIPLTCIDKRSFSRRSSSCRSSSCNCSLCNCCFNWVREVGVAVLNVGLSKIKRFISISPKTWENYFFTFYLKVFYHLKSVFFVRLKMSSVFLFD